MQRLHPSITLSPANSALSCGTVTPARAMAQLNSFFFFYNSLLSEHAPPNLSHKIWKQETHKNNTWGRGSPPLSAVLSALAPCYWDCKLWSAGANPHGIPPAQLRKVSVSPVCTQEQEQEQERRRQQDSLLSLHPGRGCRFQTRGTPGLWGNPTTATLAVKPQDREKGVSASLRATRWSAGSEALRSILGKERWSDSMEAEIWKRMRMDKELQQDDFPLKHWLLPHY